MSIARKFKTALDETRLLMLGSQILFGFQFNSTFQTGLEKLSSFMKMLDAAALLLMSITIGLLISPSARHRLAHEGEIDPSLFRATNFFGSTAMFPFSVSLGIDVYIVMARLLGAQAGWMIAALFWVTAVMFWYGFEFASRDRTLWNTAMAHESKTHTPVTVRVEQILTEARVILPGAQALLAFQLLATFTQAFEELPRSSQLLHAFALGCVALAVILLIAPAAFHRIAFNGADSERFCRIGSGLVTSALFPFALGMAVDVYVATAKLLANATSAGIAAMAVFLLLIVLWYGYPLLLRSQMRKTKAADL